MTTSEAPAGLQKQYRQERWAAALGLFALILALLAAGTFEPLENRVSELRARLLDRPPTGQVAIVEIDAKSLTALNNWPWPRRYHGELIQRLGTVGASMIAFDVDFSARSNAADDRAMAEALARVHPVILPTFQQRASDKPDERSIIKSRPADPFGDAWVGGVNILPGKDGVVRDFPAATMINGQIVPSMAVLLSDNGGLGDRTFVPDWSIDVDRIPRLSFVDVLRGRVPAKALAGKKVIVGATAIEIGDRYAIPRFGTVPGVVIQALAAESLMQHRAVTRSGLAPTLCGLMLISLLLLGRFPRFGQTFAPSAAATFGVLLVLPVAVQYRWPLSIDTAPLLVAAIGAVALRLIVEARHRVRLAAVRDPETGLPNERALAAALQEQRQTGTPLIAAAIDRFEPIRSAIAATDVAELIIRSAERIEAQVDSPVYRLAPDTLAWLASVADEPERSCEQIAEAFARPVETPRAAIDVAWTFGLAAGEATPTETIERALAAVTDARRAGRNRQWFRGLAPEALRDLSIMGELRRGIDEGQLFVAYQPKLHLESGRITHAEALVRWRHPIEGLVPPDRFIPLAEETGVVREITRFVLERVIADQTAPPGGCPIAVSVNVSAADIGRSEFAEEVVGMLSTAKADPGRLTLEITESAIIGSKETALRVLSRLRDLGIRLSIDDYGTGQSTLSYLKTLPVDELKIDKMFVMRLRQNWEDQIMVQSTIDLAHRLGLTVVAEGVEDWETAKILKELGCDYAQGFVVGRGMSLDELQSLTATMLKRAA